METKKYTIGFATTSSNNDRSLLITVTSSLPVMDSATYLRLSGCLTYFDHHRPNIIQFTNEQGIYFLFPVPQTTDLEMIRAIANDIDDGDPTKDLVRQFGDQLEQLVDRAEHYYLYLRIHTPKAA